MRDALSILAAAALVLTAPAILAAERRETTDAVPPEMRLEPLPRRAPEPKDNPGTADKIALGRSLFFDPILSATRDVACATCHHPSHGWGDGRAVPIGTGGMGIGPDRVFRTGGDLALLARNAPSIVNVAFNGLVAGQNLNPALAPMFWDARVSSLETQALAPIRAREEMRGDACAEGDAVERAVERVHAVDEYRSRFSKAFDAPADTAVTAQHLAQAIAAFERSVIAVDSPFDRFLRGDAGALNAEQQRGLRVFQDAGCVRCHGGPMLSDFKLHFIGVPDATTGGRREFRTPTLRNLRHTAPYMHNGSLRTLDDVLRFYDELSEAVSEALDGGDTSTQPLLDPLLHRLNLNPDDFPALSAFLGALNDDNYPQSVPQ